MAGGGLSFDDVLIRAFVEGFTQEELVALRKRALANCENGVTITETTFETGSARGVPNQMSSERLTVIAQRALDSLKGDGAGVEVAAVLPQFNFVRH